jgi:hypothetical protein
MKKDLNKLDVFINNNRYHTWNEIFDSSTGEEVYAKMIYNIKYFQNMTPLKSIRPWVKNVQNV